MEKNSFLFDFQNISYLKANISFLNISLNLVLLFFLFI